MPTTLTTGLATKWHWTIEQGELVNLRVPVLDSAGVPFTVTGWSVDAKIKTRPGGDLLYTWASGNTLASGTNVTLTILPATSSAWTFQRGWWRCVIQHPSDVTQRYRIVEGAFDVSRD